MGKTTTSASQTPHIANLLEHSAWLRRLAGHLVFEREDSVQDVWVSALRAPPAADRPAQPWLSRVLKNAARRRHRDASLRREKEEAAAAMAAQDVPTPEELVARAETQRLLAELVLGLSEPFRRVVLLRYYEGLSAAEIARALEVPAGTVRWQLKEGIDRLRSALDSRFGMNGQTWTSALALIAVLPRDAPSMLGAGLMTTKLKIAAIAVSLISLAPVGITWRAGPPVPRRSREQASLTSPASPNLSHSVAASANRGPTADDARSAPHPAPVARAGSEPPAGRAESASAPLTRFWNLPSVVDRSPTPGPRSDHVTEALGYAFQTLDEDVAGCLAKTGQPGSGRPGEIMVAFGISKGGLGKVWIVDGGAEVPVNQQSCFTNAVHGLDWSNIVDEPVEVTKRFDLQRLQADGR